MTAIDHPEVNWRRVSPKYAVIELISGLIWVLLFAAVTVYLYAFVEAPLIAWIWPLALGVISLISAFFAVRRARAIGYAMRDDDLIMRRGIMWSRIVAVPYGRLQLVDVQQGPIARMFGLATLRLVTAAAISNVTIPGIPVAEANALRDQLIAVAESRRAGI